VVCWTAAGCGAMCAMQWDESRYWHLHFSLIKTPQRDLDLDCGPRLGAGGSSSRHRSRGVPSICAYYMTIIVPTVGNDHGVFRRGAKSNDAAGRGRVLGRYYVADLGAGHLPNRDRLIDCCRPAELNSFARSLGRPNAPSFPS
jgi:hypothetical protein